MIVEALGSVLLGCVFSWAAVRWLSDRLPEPRVVYASGTLGALFGAYLTHAAIGSGHPLATLLGALLVAGVTLSLLVRPAARRLRRGSAAA
ncbi:hypothetical protein ABZ532_02615 [Streptomyces sp. NPDC019396]|uniref:hypothetical protein n=1 Tax=Streptomyces sp. NPDC019396 TaxID=3154687 RepID=UPI00340B2C52